LLAARHDKKLTLDLEASCGIVGITSLSQINPYLILLMCDTLSHRGPDDSGVWWLLDGRVGLAHRRLAVIDLSPGGHQPMADHTDQLRIIFSGEIYNYQELRRELESQGH
jgi:asparagine synthase (glutamine-hydrolysing)